jgi:phosphate/sulfate permease
LITIDETGSPIFGLVVGYITYRTLARTVGKSAISDLAAVVAAIGGGAVAKQYQNAPGHQFAWYAIGIAVGMAFFLLLFRRRSWVCHLSQTKTRSNRRCEGS